MVKGKTIQEIRLEKGVKTARKEDPKPVKLKPYDQNVKNSNDSRGLDLIKSIFR